MAFKSSSYLATQSPSPLAGEGRGEGVHIAHASNPSPARRLAALSHKGRGLLTFGSCHAALR